MSLWAEACDKIDKSTGLKYPALPIVRAELTPMFLLAAYAWPLAISAAAVSYTHLDVYKRQVSDVSTDEKLASLIVSRCNRLQLDPVHLHDVIEDSFSPLWQEK